MNKIHLSQVVIVGLGGFIGSSARFILSGLVHRLSILDGFPFGTLLVNIIGCVLIGYLGGMMEFKSALGPSQRLFLLVGVLGGFTTYSSFAYETVALAHSAEFGKALVNTLAHVVLGFVAAWCGYIGAQNL